MNICQTETDISGRYLNEPVAQFAGEADHTRRRRSREHRSYQTIDQPPIFQVAKGTRFPHYEPVKWFWVNLLENFRCRRINEDRGRNKQKVGLWGRLRYGSTLYIFGHSSTDRARK